MHIYILQDVKELEVQVVKAIARIPEWQGVHQHAVLRVHREDLDRIGCQKHVQEGGYTQNIEQPIRVYAGLVADIHVHMRHQHVGHIKQYHQCPEPRSDVFARDVVDVNADVIITENIEDRIVICVCVWLQVHIENVGVVRTFLAVFGAGPT